MPECVGVLLREVLQQSFILSRDAVCLLSVVQQSHSPGLDRNSQLGEILSAPRFDPISPFETAVWEIWCCRKPPSWAPPDSSISEHLLNQDDMSGFGVGQKSRVRLLQRVMRHH